MEPSDYEQDVLCQDFGISDLNLWHTTSLAPTTTQFPKPLFAKSISSHSQNGRQFDCDPREVSYDTTFSIDQSQETQSDNKVQLGASPGSSGATIQSNTVETTCPLYAVPRVSTPIPTSTVRHTYLEAVRELIDADTGGDSLRSPTKPTKSSFRKKRLSTLRWRTYRHISTQRSSSSSSTPTHIPSNCHLSPLARTKRAILYGLARAFRKRSTSPS